MSDTKEQTLTDIRETMRATAIAELHRENLGALGYEPTEEAIAERVALIYAECGVV